MLAQKLFSKKGSKIVFNVFIPLGRGGLQCSLGCIASASLREAAAAAAAAAAVLLFCGLPPLSRERLCGGWGERGGGCMGPHLFPPGL